MHVISEILLWIVSWLLSAILLIPCLLLSLLTGFTKDYHYMFHLWWAENVLNKPLDMGIIIVISALAVILFLLMLDTLTEWWLEWEVKKLLKTIEDIRNKIQTKLWKL